MLNLSLVSSAFSIALALALGGCYSVSGARGLLPYVPAHPVVGTAGAASSNRVVGYAGTTCKAGFYICQVPQGPVGSSCSCPGLGAPSFGTIR